MASIAMVGQNADAWVEKITARCRNGVIQVQELLQQLRDARLHAVASEMEDAKHHIDEVLELLDEALAHRAGPKPSVRAIRGYIAEARFAASKSDSRSAVAALDSALRVLEETPAAKGE